MVSAPPDDGDPAAETVALADDPSDAILDSPERSSGSRRKRQIIEWVLLLGSALLIALLIKTFLFQAFFIPSESMYPTLKKDDRVLVNKLSYRLHDVNRGDVVVFKAPEGESSNGIEDLVKRVVALPGETVEGRDGRIYVDGRLLEEPYLPDNVVSTDFAAQTVPEGHYWMMGDNRQNSKDSTFFGPIPESDIVGRVFVKIWPAGDITFL